MSTAKVLKSNKQEAVQVSEGSNLALRKRSKPQTAKVPPVKQQAEPKVKTPLAKATAPEKAASPAKATAPAKVAAPAKAVAPKKAAVQAKVVAPTSASTAAKKTRKPVRVPEAVEQAMPASTPKPRAKAPSEIQESPAAVDASNKPSESVPDPVKRAPIPETELWEKDSPVMRRISLLRTRNAQLSEQVHKLKKPH